MAERTSDPNANLVAEPTSVELATALIKQFEGCKLTAYKCPAGKWTIGYGHTGKDVTKGMVITQEQAEALLVSDLNPVVCAVCNSLSSATTVTKYQLAALFSFTYNVGIAAFKESTLLKLLNAGNYAGAAKEFARWNKTGKQILSGLTKRRKEEAKLFTTPT